MGGDWSVADRLQGPGLLSGVRRALDAPARESALYWGKQPGF